MKILRKIIENKKIVFVLDIIFIIIAVVFCSYIYKIELQKAVFITEVEQFSEENKNPVFKIGKIVLYKSANAIDNSDGKLEDINISQFTDIAIYINNKSTIQNLTAENTIKEMYIDNIKLTFNLENGKYIINYKNPKEFGKYVALENYYDNKISFNILTSNQEVENADLDNNIYYTDCSNPITLGFINKDFINNGKVLDTSGQLLFDGSILKNANVNLETISGIIEFSIHIKNNLGENFICNVVINNDLTNNQENILNGYSIEINEPEGQIYDFLKYSVPLLP